MFKEEIIYRFVGETPKGVKIIIEFDLPNPELLTDFAQLKNQYGDSKANLIAILPIINEWLKTRGSTLKVIFNGPFIRKYMIIWLYKTYTFYYNRFGYTEYKRKFIDEL